MTDPPSVGQQVRAFICELGPGDHGHTNCWHLSMAADIIDAREVCALRPSPELAAELRAAVRADEPRQPKGATQ